MVLSTGWIHRSLWRPDPAPKPQTAHGIDAPFPREFPNWEFLCSHCRILRPVIAYAPSKKTMEQSIDRPRRPAGRVFGLALGAVRRRRVALVSSS